MNVAEVRVLDERLGRINHLNININCHPNMTSSL